MEKSKAIELLKQALDEVPKLKKLHYNNQYYKLWVFNIENIIKAGLDAGDYERLDFVQSKYFPDELGIDLSLEDHSLPKLNDYETALKSIIQKYEIPGIETESEPRLEPKDAAELPVYLFDKMQFHPRVVKASKTLFTNGHYAEAIFAAFRAVENFVRKKAGSTFYGKQLMATVFNENNPIIQVPEAGHFNKDVQEGFKFLFMGGALGIRNPKAHDEVIQKDSYITLEYLGFASFLLKRIDYWEAGTT